MMLKEQITQDMKIALKSREAERLSVLRMLLAEIKQKEIDQQITLSDEETVALISKMIKQRQESEKIYQEANREDLAHKEAQEILVLKVYLPEQLDESEIQEKIQQVIFDLNASTKADMGKVMGVLKKDLAGRADMSKVSQIVKQSLK
ncbi:GatB/YqeY domain-containing protein [Neisseriaceae bacterium PsAf]|nr:GatB/YqeY domain-containing protein [Neisseriaceae bacterium PsAf]